MAKLRYSWNEITSGDIISFKYNKKRRTVLVISPKYRITKVDNSRVELMSGLQLETQEKRALPNMVTVLKQLGKLILIDEDNEIWKIGTEIPKDTANFEFVGIALFSKKGIEILRKFYKEYPKEDNNSDFNKIIQKIIDKGHKVSCLEVHKGWAEIHNFDDYKRVSSMLSNN